MRQEPQLGTGHALQQAAPMLDDDSTTLVLNGDVPLIEADTRARSSQPRGGKLALLTGPCSIRTGYGRIVRDGDAGARHRRAEGRRRRAARDPPRSTPASWPHRPSRRNAGWRA